MKPEKFVQIHFRVPDRNGSKRMKNLFIYFNPNDHRKVPEVGEELDIRTYLPHKGADPKLMHLQEKYIVERIEVSRYAKEVINEWHTCIVYLRRVPDSEVAPPIHLPERLTGSRIA